MAFIPAENGALVKVYGEMFGEVVINTYQFRFGEEPVIDDLTALANAMDVWAGTTLLPSQGEQLQLCSYNCAGVVV